MRTCGPCTACCTVMGVEEIKKLVHTRCDKLCSSGCSVYESRPQSCQDFVCVWLKMGDHLRVMDRPDVSGILLDLNREDNDIGEMVLVAHEVRPGAFNEDAAKDLLKRLSKRVVVFMLNKDSTARRMLGPEGDIRRIEQKLKARKLKLAVVK